MAKSGEEQFMLSLNRQINAEKQRYHKAIKRSRRYKPVLLKRKGFSEDDTSQIQTNELFDDQFYLEIKDKESQISSNDSILPSLPDSDRVFINDHATERNISKRNNQQQDAEFHNTNYIDSQYFPFIADTAVSRLMPTTSDNPDVNKSDSLNMSELGDLDQVLFTNVPSDGNFSSKATFESANNLVPKSGMGLNDRKNVMSDMSAKAVTEVSDDKLNYFDEILFGLEDTQSTSSNAHMARQAESDVTLYKLTKPAVVTSQSSSKSRSDDLISPAQQHHTSNPRMIQKVSSTKELKSSGYEAESKPASTSQSEPDQGLTNRAASWRRAIDNMRKFVPDLENEPAYSVIDNLIDNIVYQDDKIVCINKPYGLPCQGGPKVHHSISRYLQEISSRLKLSDRLYLCHRLDRDTTGTILLAKNAEVGALMKKTFETRLVEKIYWAITRGVPTPTNGSIDIPINIDTLVENAYRSTLLSKDTKSRKKSIFSAQTEYEVLKTNESRTAALVELKPITGRKHQIRVHLADAIDTPVLGDHKYSHKDTLAPQKLPGDILKAFRLPQSKARHIPMHLHSKQLIIQNYFREGKPLTLSARLPQFFLQTIKLLRLA